MLQMSKKNSFLGLSFFWSTSSKRGCSLRGLRKWRAMTSQIRGKGKERHRKVPARLLVLLSIFISLGIMSIPSF